MSPDGSVVARHVWKRFRADETLNVRDELSRVIRRADRSWRWVLRDIDFELKPGESLGLIGTNGSGKSTLLKILTRVMYPYAGSVEVGGRVGALIEIQAGLHPELSGRENVFLYGSLMGIPRAEVVRSFDAIIAFAELEDAVDRQLKFYSSGMRMRLGFSVAAFLRPDVLLVDEVLAVGDANFQQKCLSHLRSLLDEGTTLVLVSHDLLSVEATCTRGLWLQDGVVRHDGPVREALQAYRHDIEANAETEDHAGPVRLVKGIVCGDDGGAPRTQRRVEITFVVETEERFAGAQAYLGISEGLATPIFSLRKDLDLLEPGETTLECVIERLPLARGTFYVWASILAPDGAQLLPWQPAATFTVDGPDLHGAPRAVVRLAPIHVESTWQAEAR
jgi:ABC-type polysaccharide/polyol phosphate transport system ATPase subunit